MIGPAIVAQAYLPLLERGAKKTIVNVTSGLASIGLDLGAKCTTYSMSKTMLNMLVGTPCTRTLFHQAYTRYCMLRHINRRPNGLT